MSPCSLLPSPSPFLSLSWRCIQVGKVIYAAACRASLWPFFFFFFALHSFLFYLHHPSILSPSPPLLPHQTSTYKKNHTHTHTHVYIRFYSLSLLFGSAASPSVSDKCPQSPHCLVWPSILFPIPSPSLPRSPSRSSQAWGEEEGPFILCAHPNLFYLHPIFPPPPPLSLPIILFLFPLDLCSGHILLLFVPFSVLSLLRLTFLHAPPRALTMDAGAFNVGQWDWCERLASQLHCILAHSPPSSVPSSLFFSSAATYPWLTTSSSSLHSCVLLTCCGQKIHFILQVLSAVLCVQILHETDVVHISWQGTDPLAHGVLKWNRDQDWPQISMHCVTKCTHIYHHHAKDFRLACIFLQHSVLHRQKK